MSRFSVRKPLTIFVAALAIIILGVVAFLRMTPDLLPNMDFPYVVIVTTYPGASPESVEAEVSKPLEQSMATLEHIKNITSSSSENYSLVILEFEDSVNLDTVGVDIQQNILSLSGQWSDSVGTPYVLKINPSLLPVEVTAVSMEGMDTVELSDFVDETLLPQLDGVPGVARISTIGSVTREIHVVIDQDMIDDVNARLADAVNRRMDDAAAELEETKAELEDAQSQLEDAQSQLDSGKDALVSQTAQAEATINQQTVAALEGRMELQQQLNTLSDTVSQLETTLMIVRPIQESLRGLETRQSDLEYRIDAIRSASERLAQADAELQYYNDRIAELEAARDAYEPQYDEEGTEIDPPDFDAQIAEIYASEEYLNALSGVSAAESALSDLGSSRYTADADILAAQAQLAATQTELAVVDATLGSLNLSRGELSDTIAAMESGLSQAKSGTTALQNALDQLDAGTIQLSEAMGVLSQTRSEGLLQIATAAAQLATNSAALESAMTQVDTGLESIEDSRENALASADITGSITMSTITSILAAQDFTMPAGYVNTMGINYMVSVGDRITDIDELRGLLLFDTGEDAIGPVYLSDVAAIFVTDNSEETYARLDGEHGLILTIEKQSNAATADVTDALADRFSQLESMYPGLRFVSLMDQGEYIAMIVRSILQSLLYGAVFAILVLLLFLRDIRPTIITLVAIPISLVFAVVLMYFTGITLNMISLSGLAVSVGMLVDNSIVVIENIYRLRAKGATAAQAAVTGARQVTGAITASTLTTVCVFLPIVFVEGITRQLFTDLALTMGFSLMASLFVALTLVPAMSRGMLKETRVSRKPARRQGESSFYRAYRGALSWSLRRKWIVLPLALILLIGSSWLAVSRGFSFMPELDMNTVSVEIRMPENATRDEAVALADEALSRMAEVEHVETIGAMMGGTDLMNTGVSYDVTAYITLTEGESGAAAGRTIQELCSDLGCEITYNSQLMDMSYLSGSGVSINVYGNHMEDLQSAAKTIADTLGTVPGLHSADDGLESAAPALHILVDKNEAMSRGYTVAQLYMQISGALTDSVSSFRMNMDDITADVLVESGDPATRSQLMSLEFSYTDANGETQSFRLRDVARIEQTVSLASIQRDNQRRYVNVTAAVDEGRSVTLVTADAQAAVAKLDLPSGVSYEFSGENEMTMEAVRQLGLMLLLGVLLVYFIMAAQFQSLLSPFIVMFTIPLAFTGGFLSLLLFGMDVSVVSLIGFVMLTGIIVNNGIVLVDYVNQLRADGLERRAALVEAGVVRLRPILMTSLTTILGLIVMALGRDAGTALMQPVAVVCIGGLLYATLMTLFVVPCIYDMLSKKEIKVLTDVELTFDEA